MGKPSGKGGSAKGGGGGGGGGKGKGAKGGGGGGGGSAKGGGGKGGGFFASLSERGTLKESEVQLADSSKDVILKLITSIMASRGDAVPSGEKRAKKGKQSQRRRRAAAAAAADEDGSEGGEKDEEEEEDGLFSLSDALAAGLDLGGDEDAADDDDDAEEPGAGAGAGASGARGPGARGDGDEEAEGDDDEDEGGGREDRRMEERVKRRLMRQLIKEDRATAKEEASTSAAAARSRKQVPDGAQVRLHLWNEERKSEKPKGPIMFERSGPEAVAELIKVGKAKLSIKGGGKKELWAYVNGGPSGEDKHNKHPVPLTSTMELANDDIVIISTKPKPKEAPSEPSSRRQPMASESSIGGESAAATTEAASSPSARGGGAASGSESAGFHLDAVRAAYRRRSGDRPWASRAARGDDQVRAESEKLTAHARSLEKSPEHEPLRRCRAALPAAGVREGFVKAVASNQVVVVSGETGSGKTTQCPNFILEDFVARGRGGECSIICTQPRRLAAIGVAERVSQERGEEVGGTVGYAVRLNCRASSQTRLLFCTTGVLLQRINEEPDLAGVTHIVVDEAHERNLHTDFLLTVLRELLPKRPSLKLILMSATLEKELFVRYFASSAGGEAREVPSVHIPGRTFPVTIRFEEDVQAAIKGRPLLGNGKAPDEAEADKEAAPGVDEELTDWIRANMGDKAAARGRSGQQQLLISPLADRRPDYTRIADLVAAILRGDLGPEGPGARDDGAVLIFLPGHDEISHALSALRSHKGVGDQRAWLLPLHGSLSTKAQCMVFKKPPSPHQRKVVLATNIAETSITIDDVTHVIDVGHVKESRYDPRSRLNVLATCFVSQAAAKQRAGRAGRVQPGVCWRLYPKQFYDRLPEFTLCEMRRTALEELVLQVRLLELGDCLGSFLRQAPEPPSSEALIAAIRTLVQIGALGPKEEGLPLTPLGFHLAHMPMDVRTAKMLIYGALTHCLSSALTIAACLSLKSPFTRGFRYQDEDQLRRERLEAFGDLRSDHLAVVRAFDQWRKAQAKGWSASRSFCDQYGLSSSTLEGVASLRERYVRHLQEVGFVPAGYSCDGGRAAAGGGADSDPDSNSEEPSLLRCVLCAGLYPNVAQIQRSSGGKGGGSVTYLVNVGDSDKCLVHPSSINARRLNEMQANHGWMLYHTKVKTSQVFLHDSTLIGALPLLLFGGGDLQAGKDRRTITVDGALRFDARREETVVLVRLLRREVDRLLLLKITDPAVDISRIAGPLLAALTELLKLEEARGGGGLRH